jgi:cysteinyl-tRNA synthetase
MRIYNTLGRRLETFVPRDEGKVGIYVCGATVQSRPHLGHGRYAVVFDVVRSYLEWLGYAVTYVRNITDVEDKIIAAANERNVSTATIVAEASEAFTRAYDELGVRPPDIEPLATEHIPEMVAMVERLIDNGHAYDSGGDVYFSVRSFAEYGRLSGRNIDELLSGARIDPDERKRDPLDFAVWKASKPDEPSWDSPWGPGRPGWHIECSAMSEKYLGFGFDIHGGGNDLIFPHHENEIAQSEAAAESAPFARFWMHNGMLTLTGEKMSKSTGHIIDLLEAVEQHPPLAVRLFYLRTHYRKPLDFSEDALRDAAASLERLWAFRRRVPGATSSEPSIEVMAAFRAAMDHDFDNAGALGVLFDAVREGNRRLDDGDDAGPWIAAYDQIASVFGLSEPARDVSALAEDLRGLAVDVALPAPTAAQSTDAEQLIEALIEHRAAARDAKDWATADTIRTQLQGLGIILEDTADGARWHRR